MAKQKRNPGSNKLEARKKVIESLFNRFKITDSQYDNLLTAAMIEAGALTFDEMIELYVRD